MFGVTRIGSLLCNYAFEELQEIDFVDKLEQMLARTKEYSESMTRYYHEKLSLLRKCNITGEDAISCIISRLPAELRNNAKCEAPEQFYLDTCRRWKTSRE